MDVNKILDALINKMHVAIGTVYAAAILAYTWITGRPIDPGLAQFSWGFYVFLAGHAFTYQKYPDKPDQQ